MAPIVEVKDVSKTFIQNGAFPWSPSTEVHAVNGVTLTVQPGDVVALVGQSGSGKTTLSRVILGLEEPTTGEVWLNQQRWDGLPEAKRRELRPKCQYVPQDAMGALNPQQTAIEHITETFQVLGGLSRREATERAAALLSSLGLGERLEALPREMSGGEQRRVTLARVLALEPLLVVADEPTSGLDPQRRGEVLQSLIGNLPDASACILITHDMSEAKEWCDRIYVMLEGQIIEEIDTSAPAPQHPYAQVLFDPWSERATAWLQENISAD